ncbi:hypothetical protein [Acrocarpospora sp. B8E8]|uniref:HNH endonuclease n=1 Tax=Acrocarpospora sp. B8E8 TaxID=3153572 RepID=UPI00325ED49E
MLGSRLDVRDSSRAGGARERELPAFLKGTMLDPDYVPPQRRADDAYSDTYGDNIYGEADGDAGQQNTPRQNTWQQFLHGRSSNTGRCIDADRSADSPTDAGRSTGGGCSAGPEGSGEPGDSGVLVAEVRQLASRIAVTDLPEGTGLCVGETEELLFARDRLDSAIAARVGRVHASGEARSACSGGHASTGTWLRASAGMSGAGASRLIRLATQLARLPVVRDRFASGTLAEGSVEAISRVTAHLDDAQAGLAEPILVDLADRASPAEIGKAGRYLRELLDPGTLADDADADYATRFLLVRPSSTGGVEGEFRLPREAGARLREFLAAYARPKGKDDDRPLRLRQADALSALLTKKVTTELLVLVRAESLPADHPTADHPTPGHPTHDADSTHAASTPASATATATDADTTGFSDARPGVPQAGDGSTCCAGGVCLTAGTDSAGAGAGSARTGAESAGGGPVSDACRTCGHAPDRLAPGLLIATGQLLPISDVHRLARTSRLVRMVVNAHGRVLDMGRAVRLATPAQRQAILARYTSCYCEGCPIPADMAEIDHVKGWADGGATDLDLLAPACTWHNRDKATHPDRYRTRRNPDGTWTLLHLGKRSRYAGRFRR